MSETGPQMTAALADGVAWVVPGAMYFGIGVTIDEAFQDGAYMSLFQPSVNATITQAPTTVEGQIALGAPGTGGALTLQFKVSSGAITTATQIEYGTVQVVPLTGPTEPLDYVPIPLYLAPTGATPIGTPASVRLTTTYSAASDMPADVVQVTLNNASYPVGRPPVSIPLPVGSLVQFGVQANASLVTPVQSSSLAVSLLPALT